MPCHPLAVRQPSPLPLAVRLPPPRPLAVRLPPPLPLAVRLPSPLPLVVRATASSLMGNIAHAPLAMFSGILDRHLGSRSLSNVGAIMAREPLLAPFPGTVPPPLDMPSDSMMAREPLLATVPFPDSSPHFKWSRVTPLLAIWLFGA